MLPLSVFSVGDPAFSFVTGVPFKASQNRSRIGKRKFFSKQKHSTVSASDSNSGGTPITRQYITTKGINQQDEVAAPNSSCSFGSVDFAIVSTIFERAVRSSRIVSVSKEGIR